MKDELADYLDTLTRGECYQLDSVIKEQPDQRTEKVWFVGQNGAKRGPFIRKTFHAEAGMGAAYLRMWEAQKAGKRFLYLPRIEECYTADGCLTVILEYVEGETLTDAVSRCAHSFVFARKVFPMLCDAVTELHEAFDPPLIHRDLKPSNIILGSAGLTIIDLGIARTFREDADEDTRHYGTRSYAPPEQFGFGQTDVRSDIYALGLVLYYCLTGETPSTEARCAGYVASAIPEPVRCVIANATALDPQERYSTVRELRAAFEAALAACDAAGEDSAVTFAHALQGEGSHSASKTSTNASLDANQHVLASKAAASARSHSVSHTDLDTAAHTRQASIIRLMNRIPLWLGILWNCFVALCCVILVAASLYCIFEEPQAGATFSQAPFALRVYAYGALALFFFIPAAIVVMDRRSLCRILPFLRRIPFRWELLVCLLLIVFAFAVVIVCGIIDARFFS